MKGMYLIDDIAITEAGLRDAVWQYTKKGDSEMKREPVHWMIDCRKPARPPQLILLSTSETRRATIAEKGKVSIWPHPLPAFAHPYLVTPDLRGLSASLQSILVLAEEHFGEDWGKAR